MSNLVDVLRSSPFFKGLKDSDLSSVAALATVETIGVGSYLLRESDKGEFLYLINKGRVDVTVSLVGESTGDEKIATLNAGELVGEMVLLGKKRRSANVKVKEQVEVLRWDIGKLMAFFESHDQVGFIFMRNIGANLAERLAATNQVLRNVLSMDKNFIF